MNSRTSAPTNTPRNIRPVSVAHLVLGLVFIGLAGVWLIAALTDTEAPRPEISGPAILIGAGVIGLAASLVNTRQRRRRTQELREAYDREQAAYTPAPDPAEPARTDPSNHDTENTDNTKDLP